MRMNRNKILYKEIIKLQLLIFVFSFLGIASKLAAGESFFSFRFFVFYGVVLINLFAYAIFWQQIIKNIPLVTAYCNKVTTIMWGMIFGVLFFGETITFNKIIGVALVMSGAIIVIQEDEKND